MYDKGANMIHTIRQVIDNDSLFRAILIGLNQNFYHRTVSSDAVENYISKMSGKNLSTIFNQYLRTTKVPTLEYYFEKNQLYYRWINTVENLLLPIKVKISNTLTFQWITPSSEWNKININPSEIKHFLTIDPNFYVTSSIAKSQF